MCYKARSYIKNITKNSSRPLAAQFFFKVYLLSKFSVLAEFTEHLPTSSDHGVIQPKIKGYMIRKTIEQIRARSIELTLAGLGTILPVWGILAENRLGIYVSTLETITIVRIVLVAIVIMAYSVGAFFYFKPRIKFDTHLQIYTDIKTGIHYCVSCKDGHDRLAKLIKQKHGWKCGVKECGVFQENTDNPKPKQTFYIPD